MFRFWKADGEMIRVVLDISPEYISDYVKEDRAFSKNYLQNYMSIKIAPINFVKVPEYCQIF